MKTTFLVSIAAILAFSTTALAKKTATIAADVKPTGVERFYSSAFA